MELYFRLDYTATVSINLERRTDAPGDATHEAQAWALKERVRREDGVLKQRRGFFSDAYRRSKTHLLFERGPDSDQQSRGGATASDILDEIADSTSSGDTDSAGRTGGTTDSDVGDLVGFVSARRDGYILFLAVGPRARGRGYGKRLVAEVADEHRTVTCHARSTNRAALEFYDSIGFDVERKIEGYYEDGGDAYYLKLGEDGGLKERLSSFLR